MMRITWCLGRTYLQRRDFANAEKELKAAIQLEPKNLTYWKIWTSTSYLAGEYLRPWRCWIVWRSRSRRPAANYLFARSATINCSRPSGLDAYERFLEADQNGTRTGMAGSGNESAS